MLYLRVVLLLPTVLILSFWSLITVPRIHALSSNERSLLQKLLMEQLGLRPPPSIKPHKRSSFTSLDLQLLPPTIRQAYLNNMRKPSGKRPFAFDTLRTFRPEDDSGLSYTMVSDDHLLSQVLSFNLESIPTVKERVTHCELECYLNRTSLSFHFCGSSSPNFALLRVNVFEYFSTHVLLLDTVTLTIDKSHLCQNVGDPSSLSDWKAFLDIGPSTVERWAKGQAKFGNLLVEVVSNTDLRHAFASLPYLSVYSTSQSEEAKKHNQLKSGSVSGHTGAHATGSIRRSKRRVVEDELSHHPQPRKRRRPRRKGRGRKRKHRHRRRRPFWMQRRRRQICRRQKLVVNFEEIGWTDWIIAPNYYHAYYCAGPCTYPLNSHHNATNHAIVQSFMESVGEAPRPCCVPRKLKAMSFLYKDEFDKVVFKTYEDMVVEECGCV